MSLLALELELTPRKRGETIPAYAARLAARMHKGWSFDDTKTVEWYREEVAAIEQILRDDKRGCILSD